MCLPPSPGLSNSCPIPRPRDLPQHAAAAAAPDSRARGPLQGGVLLGFAVGGAGPAHQWHGSHGHWAREESNAHAGDTGARAKRGARLLCKPQVGGYVLLSGVARAYEGPETKQVFRARGGVPDGAQGLRLSKWGLQLQCNRNMFAAPPCPVALGSCCHAHGIHGTAQHAPRIV